MFKTTSPEYFTQPLDSCEIIAKSILRPELYEILQQADNIQRFTGLGFLPSSIQGETVKAHTLRLISMIDDLPGDEQTKRTLQITLAIHDLPETSQLIATNQTSDTTATDKALSLILDQQVSATEEQVAMNIFNDNEYELYLEFEKASDYLKGRSQDLPTEIGLISKICDRVDADVRYHVAAIASRNNWQEFGDKGPKLGFDLYIACSTMLDDLKDTRLSNASILCQELLDNAMLTIQEMWGKVVPDEVPLIIWECLDNFQIHS